jgi:hypothetical protein
MSGEELRRMFALCDESEKGDSSKEHMKLYALLQCWYEGDSNLVDDSFLGIFSTVEKAEAAVPHEEGVEVQVFLPGQKVPDDGQYADARRRYRIIPVTVDHRYLLKDISDARGPVSNAAEPDATETNAPVVALKPPEVARGSKRWYENMFASCHHYDPNDAAQAPKSPQPGPSVILGEGWFVYCHHDLRGGLWYEGPYDEGTAKSRAAEHKIAGGWDEVNVLFLPFIKNGGHVYALWPEAAAITPNPEGESRAASARTLHPLVGSSEVPK